MFHLDTPEIKFAINAVRKSSILAQYIYSEMVQPAAVKEDRSPVTVADFSVQAVITYLLRREFPNEVMVAEENSKILRKKEGSSLLKQVTQHVSGVISDISSNEVCDLIDVGCADPSNRFWTLDPIDGTKGFIRGAQYAVGLALIEEGVVKIGILGCPNLGEAQSEDINGLGSLIVAERGQGTWCSSLRGECKFKPLRVSERSVISEAVLLRSYEERHTNEQLFQTLVQKTKISKPAILMDSLAKYALLASGAGDILVRLISKKNPNYREKIWDQASGALIIEEAGGRITDLDGKGLDFTSGRTLSNNRGILATNGALHSVFLDLLQKVS